MLSRVGSHSRVLRTTASTALFSTSHVARGDDSKSKAGQLMNLVPGNNVLTKTGFLSLLTGLTAYGISKEIIVLHNETLLVVTTGAVLALAYNKLSGPFQAWADSEREELRKKINSSMETKKAFLSQQIEDSKKASQIQQVIEGFYDTSKEIAVLEAEVAERQAKLDYHNHVKVKLEALYHQEIQFKEIERKERLQELIDEVIDEASSPGFQERYLRKCINSLATLNASN